MVISMVTGLGMALAMQTFVSPAVASRRLSNAPNGAILERVRIAGFGIGTIRISGAAAVGADFRDRETLIVTIQKAHASKRIHPIQFHITRPYPYHLSAWFGVYKRINLLAISGDGGQFDFTVVYELDCAKSTLKPVSPLIMMGEGNMLHLGKVVEHSPARYVIPKLPEYHRIRKDREVILRNDWKLDLRRHKFVQGAYHQVGDGRW